MGRGGIEMVTLEVFAGKATTRSNTFATQNCFKTEKYAKIAARAVVWLNLLILHCSFNFGMQSRARRFRSMSDVCVYVYKRAFKIASLHLFLFLYLSVYLSACF